MMQQQDLPEDVWLKIIKYLHPHQANNLHSVNRPLLSIVLDIRYRTVTLDDFERTHTLWLLQRLKDPYVACRVRSLSLRTSLLRRALGPSSTAGGSPPISEKLRRHIRICPFGTVRRKAPRLPPPSVLLQDLTMVISGLLNIEEYSLDAWFSTRMDVFEFTIPVYLGAWQIFQHLRSLTLDIQLEAMRQILLPTPRLPLLSKLVLSFSKAYLTTDALEIMRDAVAPFINEHSDTLTGLVLRAYDNRYISAFLLMLKPLVTLNDVALTIPYASHNQTDLTGLVHTLVSHSSHLHGLDLSFVFPMAEFSHTVIDSDFYSLPLWRTELPRLKRFSLRLAESRNHLPSLFPYLKLLSPSLVELTLSNYTFSTEELATLLRIFSRQDHDHSLRSLSLAIYQFRPSVLDQISGYLPGLESLHLLFRDFYPDLNPENPSPRKFAFLHQLRRKRYPQWRLRHFTWRATGYLVSLAYVERALAIAIPSLVTINGAELIEDCGASSESLGCSD